MAQNDDIDEAIRRMASEFGPRRPREGEVDTPAETPIAPPPHPPLSQPSFPPPPPQQQAGLRVRLPAQQPVIVWLLLGLNVLLFVASVSLTIFTGQMRRLGEPDGSVLQALGWKDNALIAQGQYWRLITAMFLHGNLIHILFNGFALYSLGPEAERVYGHVRFAAVYFLSGIAGGIASYAFSPSPSVGASGAIFGLFGALIAFYFVGRKVLGDFSRMQLQSMGGVIVVNLLIGFTVPGIDNYAHLGGLAGGLIVGWLLAPRFAINDQVYPPVLARSWLPIGWAGALAFLLVLAVVVMGINPPLL